MAVLTDNDIRAAVQGEILGISPFNPDLCEPASYDLTLGKVLRAKHGAIKLQDGEDFVLPGGQWAAIASKEALRMPENLCATYGLRSTVTRKGLLHFGGPQIDPGYHGLLFVSIYNPTMEPIVLKFGEPLITVMFYKLTGNPSETYSGKYQNLLDFPAPDVERMMAIKSTTLPEVANKVETLDDSVKTLSDNLKILTTDVHSIRGSIDYFKSKGWKLTVWLLGAFVVAFLGMVTTIIVQQLT